MLPALEEALGTPEKRDFGLAELAAFALKAVTGASADCCREIADGGILPALVSLLRHSTVGAATKAAGALAHLAMAGDGVREKIITAGACTDLLVVVYGLYACSGVPVVAYGLYGAQGCAVTYGLYARTERLFVAVNVCCRSLQLRTATPDSGIAVPQGWHCPVLSVRYGKEKYDKEKSLCSAGVAWCSPPRSLHHNK